MPGRREYMRRQRKKNYNLKGRYGVTLEEWETLFEWQGRKCGACGSEHPGSTKGWSLDHCHGTGEIRGILCHGCNVALGHAGHDPERLELLAEYMKEYLERLR